MATITERQPYFTGLAREYYISSEIFAQELERVWARQWLYFGHLSQIPAAGDYLVRELAGESVIVVRSADGDVRAFLNVCRHRGYRFCEQGPGKAKHFVCPYHRWSYDINGRLMGVPTMRDGEYFDYSDWGLQRVHCELWRGFVFICLGESPPPPLLPALEQCGTDLGRLSLEAIKEAHAVRYEVACNWKILMENYLECYHCTANHPEFCNAANLRLIYERIARSQAGPVVEIAGGVPATPGHRTLSPDGELVCTKLLGDETELSEGFGAGVRLQPAVSAILFHIDHGVVHEIRPLSSTRTEFINRWFVHEDALPGRDYELGRLTAVWDITNQQDKALCERTQPGVQSLRFVPGPNSVSREPSINAALTVYRALMGLGEPQDASLSAG
jgi:phenylpropionate dioxygenase-like ring-hydroxylating dioxygenase large terminal subunit